jgi:hypothetical protein
MTITIFRETLNPPLVEADPAKSTAGVKRVAAQYNSAPG